MSDRKYRHGALRVPDEAETVATLNSSGVLLTKAGAVLELAATSLAADSVDTAELKNGAVTNAKLGLTGGTNLVQTYATAEETHAARTAAAPAAATAAALTDNSGGAAADGTIAAVPTQRAGYVYYQNIATAAGTGGGDQLDIAAAIGGETVANLVQPDVPRCARITVTDANASITAFQIDYVGTGINGEAVSEQFLFAGGLTQVGSKVFAKITSITVTSIAGNGAADTLDVGYGDKIGVPVPQGATGLGIVKLVSNATEEAAAAVDATNNSFTPTTGTNGTNDYEVWYEFIDPGLVACADAVKELSDQINKLITDLADVRTQLAAEIVDALDTASFANALVDQLQARTVIP